MGSWLSYGLGGLNKDLPSFCVVVSKDKGGQPLYARLWGNGFLPASHQGVQFRSGADPVLFLSNPPGITDSARQSMLKRWAELQRLQKARTLDPHVESRIAQYELGYRMQTSVRGHGLLGRE